LLLVPGHVRDRETYETRQEKKAIAAEIETDPLANDDEPAHEDLPEWISPMYTGGKFDWYAPPPYVTLNLVATDDGLDDRNYVKERVNFLVKFIAGRDGYDLRPDIRAGKYGLDELEQFYEGGLDPDAMDDMSGDNGGKGKGKGKSIDLS
jgi:hypothetical protein